MLKTIKYAGAVLDLFSPSHPSWRLTQIADEVGLPTSTTHDLVSSLVDAGLLVSPSRGIYEINWQILHFASLIERGDDLLAYGVPIVSALGRGAAVTVQLVVLRRWQVHCMHSEPQDEVLQLALPAAGESFAAHTSAAGKALLASRGLTEVRRFIHDVGAPSDSTQQRVRWDAFERELARVRARGFGVDNGGHVDGVCCLAAPVGTPTVQGIAAIGAIVPAYRFERTRTVLERVVTDAAVELSQVLSSGRHAERSMSS